MIGDITGCKQAEQKLRGQAAKIRKLAAELARLKKTGKKPPKTGGPHDHLRRNRSRRQPGDEPL